MSAVLSAYRADVLRDCREYGPTTALETARRTGLNLTQAGNALRWWTYPGNGKQLLVDEREGKQAPLYSLAPPSTGSVRAWRAK